MQLQLTAEDLVKSRNAKRMALWLYIVSMVMIFAGLTSAFIVKSGEKSWRVFELPSMFYISTAIILASSGTMHLALRAARANQIGTLQTSLGITAALGIAFLTAQIIGFRQLVDIEVNLVGNASESFVYIMTGLHAMHLVGGLIAVLVVLVQALRLQVGAERIFGLQQAATFWHSLDVLWLYLFLFLLVNLG